MTGCPDVAIDATQEQLYVCLFTVVQIIGKA